MLTYSRFGNNGRLGNQMFQFATLYAFAKQNNLKYILPKITNQDIYQTTKEFDSFILNDEIKDSFVSIERYQDWYLNSKVFRYDESSFSYKKISINTANNIDFCGYFQSEKYFKDFKKDLIDLYKPLIKSPKCLSLEVDIKNKETISLHVRRGDYLTKSNFHTNLSNTEYYQKALEHFKGEKYLIFSDDLDFCKTYFRDLKNAEFVEGLSTTEELYLQTKCHKSIVANSSFSWWGAWLKEESKAVIAPKEWFGKDGPKDISDLYPLNWKII
jgi:hypothetical protein